jgi:ubiquitin-protein ligase
MHRHLNKLIKDLKDLHDNPLENVKVAYDEDNIKNIYCMIHNLTDNEYKNGQFIFNIKLSNNHPMEPPDFYFLTPNFRFEINKKLCFTNSSYHKESWSPMWNLRTIILGFLSFFLEKESKGIGHIEKPFSENKKIELTNDSIRYNSTNLLHILEKFN